MGTLIELDVTGMLKKVPLQGRNSRKPAMNINWQKEIVAGNDAMTKSLLFTAYDHYKVALNIAKNFFKIHQHDDNVPDNLIPAIVVSYLNICDLWSKQNKTAARRGYLCAAFDYLVAQLQTPNIGAALQEQLRCGLDKVFVELIKLGDKEIMAMKKQDLMKL